LPRGLNGLKRIVTPVSVPDEARVLSSVDCRELQKRGERRYTAIGSGE